MRHVDIDFSATQSIGLLSYTFLKSTGKEDIVVPMVMTFNLFYLMDFIHSLKSFCLFDETSHVFSCHISEVGRDLTVNWNLKNCARIKRGNLIL